MQSFLVLEITPQKQTIFNKFISNLKHVNSSWFYIFDTQA